MMRINGPDIKKFLDKKIQLKLNKNRSVTGILRGYDQFMNLTLDQAKDKETSLGLIVIRGNSVELIEALEFIPEK